MSQCCCHLSVDVTAFTCGIKNVCVRVRVPVCVYVCTCASVCTRVCMHVLMYVCAHVHARVHMCMCVHTHVCMCQRVHAHVPVRVQAACGVGGRGGSGIAKRRLLCAHGDGSPFEPGQRGLPLVRVWATRAAAAGAVSAGRLRALQGRRRDSLGHACRCGTTVVQSTLSHGSPRACRASPADFVSPGNNSRGVRAFFFFFF